MKLSVERDTWLAIAMSVHTSCVIMDRVEDAVSLKLHDQLLITVQSMAD